MLPLAPTPALCPSRHITRLVSPLRQLCCQVGSDDDDLPKLVENPAEILTAAEPAAAPAPTETADVPAPPVAETEDSPSKGSSKGGAVKDSTDTGDDADGDTEEDRPE